MDREYYEALTFYTHCFEMTHADMQLELESIFNESIFNDSIWIGYDLLLHIDRIYSKLHNMPEVGDDESLLLSRYSERIIEVKPNLDIVIYPRSLTW